VARTALLLGLALNGCAPRAATSTPPTSPPAQPTAIITVTATAFPTLAFTSTPVPSLTPSPSPTVPVRAGCPEGSESCILDWPLPFQRPIQAPGNAIADPTYRYGSTQSGAREPHHGIDMPNAYGTPVYAAADGTVVVAGSDKVTLVSPWPNFYGDVVVLEHQVAGVDAPVYTLYGHLSAIDVSAGQTVTAGQKIGEVGASGVAVGSHLHFEVRLGNNDYGSSRNPELWLVPAMGDDGTQLGLLAVRVAEPDGRLVPTVMNVEYFADPSGEVTRDYPVEVYGTREKYPVNSDDVLDENFMLGSLPAGHYRVTFVYWGTLYQRWVEIDPGKLTYVPFDVP
jgi:murein DD-endopeptidase MepM/ murein hydrolase activator NlpD